MTLTAATMSKLEWEIGNIQSNQKGVKSGTISKKGALVFLSLANSSQPLTTPFGASAFNDEQATRKNICFRCSPSLVEKMNKIDAYMTQYIDKNSNRLFKNKKVTYKPLLCHRKMIIIRLSVVRLTRLGKKSCDAGMLTKHGGSYQRTCGPALWSLEFTLDRCGSWVITVASLATSRISCVPLLTRDVLFQ